MSNYKCIHGKQKYRCKECGGSAICEHGKRNLTAKNAVEVLFVRVNGVLHTETQNTMVIV